MSISKIFGLVDENCQVQGISNLDVAGSSVFPTSGLSNPTFAIIALAIRLTDHLKVRMGFSPGVTTLEAISSQLIA